MMQEYPDAKQHFEQHLDGAIKEYRAGLEKRGLQPNETINRAFFDRTVKAARQDYQSQCDEAFLHNFQKVEAESKRIMKQINRRGTLQAFLMCPPIALVFAALAWYNFSQHDPATGIVCCCGVLTFLAILIVKVVVDR